MSVIPYELEWAVSYLPSNYQYWKKLYRYSDLKKKILKLKIVNDSVSHKHLNKMYHICHEDNESHWNHSYSNCRNYNTLNISRLYKFFLLSASSSFRIASSSSLNFRASSNCRFLSSWRRSSSLRAEYQKKYKVSYDNGARLFMGKRSLSTGNNRDNCFIPL